MAYKDKLLRGEKWLKVLKKSVFKEDKKTTEWLKSQKSIVSDMENYTNSKKQTVEVTKDTEVAEVKKKD